MWLQCMCVCALVFASSISALRYRPAWAMAAAVISIARVWRPPHSLALTGPAARLPRGVEPARGGPYGPGHGEDGHRLSLSEPFLFSAAAPVLVGGWRMAPPPSLSFLPSFFPFFLTTLTLTLPLTLCGISLQFRLLYLRKVNPSRVHLTTDLLIDGSGASQVLTDLPPSVNLTQSDHTIPCCR
jgi:hypothetical protein